MEDGSLIKEVMVVPSEILSAILEAGKNGNHILFETDMIRRAFRREENHINISDELLQEINYSLQMITELPSFEEKRQHIGDLSPEVRNLLIRLYFQILDKYMNEYPSELH